MHTPTHILSSTQQGAKITVKLYGAITPERLAKEQQELDHRSEQLNTRTPVKSGMTTNRKMLPEQDEEFFGDDPFDVPFQSTGR